MSLVIVNTRVANLSSVKFAFERLGVSPVISADPQVIRDADRVVLPGVGTAPAAMRSLQELGLVDTIQQLTQPVLGICLGMQILCEFSDEGSDKTTQCLNLIPTQVHKLRNKDQLPLPHMGWNQTQVSDHPLFKGLNNPWFYFVHSFAVPADTTTGSINSVTIAEAEYTQRFSAAIANRNFMGVQFHPERSGKDGAKVLSNFLEITCWR